MQAGDVKLGSIFFNNHRYEIPMFQRPYVWGEKRNWVPLWEDISAAATTVLEDMHSGEWPEEPPTYFLGSIVVKATPRNPQRLAGSMLVDGQQRLTTLQVLLAAARSVARELGAESAEGRFSEWVDNSDRAVHDNYPDDRYKVWPLPQDRDEYLWAVRHPDDDRPCPDDEHRIAKARRWFEDAIRSWALAEEDAALRLEALHSAMETRMALVRITLEKTDNAQVIFEALNHRGVELSQSDLIKNLLFRLVEDQGERKDAESLLVNHWLPLDGRAWRKETITGRIRRSRLDQVIAYWLTGRKEKTVSVENLFDEFKAWILEGDHRASDVIRDIRKYADLYESLIERPDHESTAVLVDTIQATGTNTVWPLLLQLYYEPSIAPDQRHKASSALSSYLVRRMLCGLTNADYNRSFPAALAVVKAGARQNGAAADALTERLGRLSGESRVWPRDEEVRAALLGSNFYSLTRARQRVFFAGIENFLRDNRAEEHGKVRATYEHLNIEHVMPQQWRKHWPLAEPTEEAVARRERAINAVGNLTLTNGRLNSQMRNSPWPTKVKALQQKSTLLVTTASILSAPSGVTDDLHDAWVTSWDEDRIDTRTRYLADLALAAWPRPDVEPTDESDLDDVSDVEESDEDQ
ncbi:DUF262 domain-containing protein [uncultured Ornithinimicrobium sp.]|uniref:DUF262 domain-containing protein n=1 Tax=uncultured Ornithinimicrobium sp. TaxID=259307 RepID=UPI00259AA481|nr:DUF262 domain-containing protein [uncultured Ornithinimicrobium sp.]